MSPWHRQSALFSRATAAVVWAHAATLAPSAAHASYHFMQIEQVVAGVDGDPQAQAIQLRMRSNSQNFVSNARILAFDAHGENPVVLADLDADLPSGTIGDRILLASEKLSVYTSPAVEPDFILENLIPESYLPAGSLVFENDDGTLLVWRLSWGGTAYDGPTGGALTNDDDGEFAPPYPDALPTSTLQSLLFTGSADAKGTSNAADYTLSAGAAVLTNYAGAMFTVTELQCPNDPDSDADDDHVCGDVDNCPSVANEDQADSDEDGPGDACDGCPNDPDKTEPGVCGCGLDDSDDDDADAVVDCLDNCPGLSNSNQADTDGDGAGDDCDECPDDPDLINVGPEGCVPSTGDGDDPGGNGDDRPPPDDVSDGDDDGAPAAPAPRACGVGMIASLLPLSLLLFCYNPGRVTLIRRRRRRL